MKEHVLIVEDDADIREILAFNLENAGFGITLAESAEEGLERISDSTSLVLLDVMLPGMNGYQMAKILRQDRKSNVPIIFLTARTTENDLLTGFSTGGDDYISKPFSINEVIARIKAVLKRSPVDQQPANLATFGPLQIDFDNSMAILEGEQLDLSRKEFDILSLLSAHPDTYFSRTDIIDRLWKDAPYVLNRTVDVHIARIRTKLGDHRELIKNKTGFGYYISVEK